LRRALATPRRGLGDRTIDALFAEASARSADPLELAAAGFSSARPAARKPLAEFAALIFEMRGRMGEPPELLLAEIIARIDYRRHLLSQGDDWEERAANVDELLGSARLWSSASEGGIGEYLDAVGLLTSVDSLPRDADAVTLMTAHNAKGLEFPVVFLTGLEDGIFPHVSAFDNQAEMEEERRLFYVACTRAKDTLVLSASLMRRRWSAGAAGLSRFLEEAPAELFTRADAEDDVDAGWRRFASAASQSGNRPPGRARASVRAERCETAGDDFDHPLVGRRVFHARFGHGIVVSAEGEDDRARVVVRFNSGDTRKLVKNYLEWED
jgi:DNA helicase-2/ATP-dependent DNA helicase PcrA